MVAGRSGRIHPTVVVGAGVELGEDVVLGPYVVLMGPLLVGDRVWVGAGSVLGAPPEISSSRQNVAWAGDLEHRGVVIREDVVIREHVVIHQGSVRETLVGPRSWLFNRAISRTTYRSVPTARSRAVSA